MNYSLNSLVLAGMGAISLTAWAGGMHGGGGMSVVCRDAAGQILKAELLDLYEARIVYGLVVAELNEGIDDQLYLAAQKLVSTPGLSEAIAGHAVDIKNRFARFVPKGTALNPTNDSFEIIAPVGCQIEQLANFLPENIVLVSEEIYSSLSETHKAAFWMHEAVYFSERKSGVVTDSRRARRIVGELFGNASHFEKKFSDVKPGDAFCIGKSDSGGISVLFGYKNPESSSSIDRYRIEFGLIDGNPIYSKTYLDVPSFIPEPVTSERRVEGQLSSKFDSSAYNLELAYSVRDGKPVVTLSGRRLMYGTKEISLTQLHCQPATEELISMPW